MDTGQPGNGKIIFSEGLPPYGPWSVAIQRASDKKFLTGKPGNPWVGETILLPAQGAPMQDGSLAINLGPEIVDCLDPQEQYSITLAGTGPDEKARLRVENITYSAARDLGRSARQPESESQPAAVPDQQATSAPVSEPLQIAPNPPVRTNGKAVWRWAILALLALGCLAWYVFDPRSGDSPEPAPAPVAEPAQKQPSQTQPALARKPGTEEQVKNFFSSPNITPQGAATLAAGLSRNTPAEQDAVYRLLYFAAENGENSVLPMYAGSLDPAMPGFGSIEKNAVEAWKVYEKMAETDPHKARAAMQRLHDWLSREAAGGNAKARDWLLKIDSPR